MMCPVPEEGVDTSRDATTDSVTFMQARFDFFCHPRKLRPMAKAVYDSHVKDIFDLNAVWKEAMVRCFTMW